MSRNFKDYFSNHSGDYLEARPHYPEQFVHRLLRHTQNKVCAWDCGAGNGQAAIQLANHFEKVFATDPSIEQIKHAIPAEKVLYFVDKAECSSFPDGCFDLIVVAQALHWFDVEQFYREVRRVATADGLLAVWCYQLPQVEPGIDRCIRAFYESTLGPYWPVERKHVDNAYMSLPFPFDPIPMPEFCIQNFWNLQHLTHYIRTWSATRRFIEINNQDPVDRLAIQLAEQWGPVDRKRIVSWPMGIRVGMVNG